MVEHLTGSINLIPQCVVSRPLDDLCHCYLGFCDDRLGTQIPERDMVQQCIAMYYLNVCLVRIIRISFCSSEAGLPCGHCVKTCVKHCVKIGRPAGKLDQPHSWVAGQAPFFIGTLVVKIVVSDFQGIRSRVHAV